MRRIKRKSVLFPLAGILPFIWIATVANADIVRLKEGQSWAGRIVEENAAGIRLKTGTPQGPHEITIQSEQITAIHRTLDEAAEIAKCTDRAMLVRWSEGYFHADTPVLAVQCIERVASLDPETRSKPCEGGTPEYQLFWNKQIFRLRSASLGETSGGRPWLELAKWSEAAGLKADARESLRRAGFLDPSIDEVRSLAGDWGVSLAPWISPHLSLALETNLFRKVIHDQQTDVEARPRFEFLLLPIRYEVDGSRRVLSRLILAKKDRAGFYGVYAMHRPPKVDSILESGDAPVFERMELKLAADGTPQVVWKNNSLPRVREGETYKQELARAKPETQRPDGWAIMVLELESGQPTVRLDWGDGSSETIDLAFLRAAREVPAEPEGILPGSPEVLRAMNHVRQGSCAFSELGLMQLAMLRQRVASDRTGEWSRIVDPVVIEAAKRRENRIDAAAWKYFAMQAGLANQTGSLFESASNSTKRRWVDIIARCGATPEATNIEIAKGLLLAMMQTGPLDVCTSSIDAMVALHIDIDWTQVSAASKNAQMAGLTRLTRLRRDEAISALLTIMKSVRRSSAEEVAKYVRSLNLRLEDPRDPLLKKWPQLKSDSDRISLVTVLQPADLGDLIYSQPFSAILKTGLSPRKIGSGLQREIFEMIVEQMKRSEFGADSDAHGQFPVLVRLRVADAAMQGLLEVGRSGNVAQRQLAIQLMMKMGLSANALAAIEGIVEEGGDFEEVLTDVIKRTAPVAADGVASLCGRLLTPDHAESAEIVLGELNRMAANTPASEQWRLRAALRTGVNMESLAELASVLKPAISVSATRWLHQLGHFSLQDGQVFAAADGSDARRMVLEELDFRRAQFVDGEYGVVAVVEICSAQPYVLQSSAESQLPPLVRWGAPRRRTIQVPSLHLAAGESDNQYTVRWNETTIGNGRSRKTMRRLRKPDGFLPALADAAEAGLAKANWGWPAPTTIPGYEDEHAIGPAIFPGNRPAVEVPSEDLMTLDVTAYLASALLQEQLLPPDRLKEFSEVPIKMTLRYAGMGSYVGVAPTRALPAAPKAGNRHMLSVMLFLEKLH